MSVKVTIKKVEKTERAPDQHGNSSWNITFTEGGVEKRGLFVGKKFDYFKIDQEVEAEVENKTSQAGKPWIKISIPKAAEGGGASPRWEDPMEIRQYWKTSSIHAAIAIIAGLEMKVKVTEVSSQVLAWMDAKNPQTKRERTGIQSALKCAHECIAIPAVKATGMDDAKYKTVAEKVVFVLGAADNYLKVIVGE